MLNLLADVTNSISCILLGNYDTYLDYSEDYKNKLLYHILKFYVGIECHFFMNKYA